jgi:hypothetical protein
MRRPLEGGRCIRTPHPGLVPGSSVVKSLIAVESFHGADAPWLDAGVSLA